jgi:2-dehydro-3-deoxyglucarate aldolase/4-hydroxy-2-oxoheptanedioate aldolase
MTLPPPPSGPLDRGRLRTRLAAGEKTVGTFVGMASPIAAEVCAAAGVDWLLVRVESPPASGSAAFWTAAPQG